MNINQLRDELRRFYGNDHEAEEALIRVVSSPKKVISFTRPKDDQRIEAIYKPEAGLYDAWLR